MYDIAKVRLQSVTFSADLVHLRRFFTCKILHLFLVEATLNFMFNPGIYIILDANLSYMYTYHLEGAISVGGSFRVILSRTLMGLRLW